MNNKKRVLILCYLCEVWDTQIANRTIRVGAPRVAIAHPRAHSYYYWRAFLLLLARIPITSRAHCYYYSRAFLLLLACILITTRTHSYYYSRAFLLLLARIPITTRAHSYYYSRAFLLLLARIPVTTLSFYFGKVACNVTRNNPGVDTR